MAELNHLPTYVLDRMVADLEVPDRNDVDAHLSACDACTARLAELKADRTAFLLEHPPAAAVAKFAESARRPWWQRFWWAAPALAAAVAAFIVLPTLQQGDRSGAVRPDILQKGGPHLSVRALLPGAKQPRPASSGERFAQGTALQLEVGAGRFSTMAVFAVRDDGLDTIWAPRPAESGPLGHSLHLDASPVAERLVLLLSRTNLTTSEAERRVREARDQFGGVATFPEKVEKDEFAMLSFLVLKRAQ